MNIPYDRNVTPPEPVDPPECPDDSPWVLTHATILNASYAEIGSTATSVLRAVCAWLPTDHALLLPSDATPPCGALRAWDLPRGITVVDLDFNEIECPRYEDWLKGKLDPEPDY